ncbi:MAG: hypothetical protein E7050_10840 [Lentisphaerae bacterium]|nr:hypothetical protein [Lentisphaerota bacterium]
MKNNKAVSNPFVTNSPSPRETKNSRLSAKREQMRQLPEFMMLTDLETRDDESADREELHRLISTLPIEKVRELLEELR